MSFAKPAVPSYSPEEEKQRKLEVLAASSCGVVSEEIGASRGYQFRYSTTEGQKREYQVAPHLYPYVETYLACLRTIDWQMHMMDERGPIVIFQPLSEIPSPANEKQKIPVGVDTAILLVYQIKDPDKTGRDVLYRLFFLTDVKQAKIFQDALEDDPTLFFDALPILNQGPIMAYKRQNTRIYCEPNLKIYSPAQQGEDKNQYLWRVKQEIKDGKGLVPFPKEFDPNTMPKLLEDWNQALAPKDRPERLTP